MRVLDLTIKDLRQLARDRMTFIFLLLMPVVFTLLFGFAFGGFSTADSRLPLGLINNDSGPLGQALVDALANSTVVRLESDAEDETALEAMVSEEDLAGALIIPAEYSARLMAGDNRQPILIVNPSGRAAFAVQNEIETALFRLSSAVEASQITLAAANEQGQSLSFDAAFRQAMAAWQQPPARLALVDSGRLANEAAESDMGYSSFAHTSPAMMTQFAIAGLMGAAGILVTEKQSRSLQRLLTVNLSRLQILTGHFLAMFLMILMQLVMLILFGDLALRLTYLRQPAATLLMTFVTAAFCASLGLLIGVLAKNEEQATVFALIPMFVLAGLGGAWVPLEVTPAAFQRVAGLTPLAWIINGYKDILIRGQGVSAVALSAAVVGAFALVLFLLARWRFRPI
jgi:ABC-2 type transport system permease protein